MVSIFNFKPYRSMKVKEYSVGFEREGLVKPKYFV